MLCVNFNYLNIKVKDGLVPPVHIMGSSTLTIYSSFSNPMFIIQNYRRWHHRATGIFLATYSFFHLQLQLFHYCKGSIDRCCRGILLAHKLG